MPRGGVRSLELFCSGEPRAGGRRARPVRLRDGAPEVSAGDRPRPELARLRRCLAEIRLRQVFDQGARD